MLESNTTMKKFFDKKPVSHSDPTFIKFLDWRHFYGAVTGDMMLLEFQGIIERALTLHAPIKLHYIRKDKQNFLLQEIWSCENTMKQLSRISDDETKKDLFRQKNTTSLKFYGVKQ